MDESLRFCKVAAKFSNVFYFSGIFCVFDAKFKLLVSELCRSQVTKLPSYKEFINYTILVSGKGEYLLLKKMFITSLNAWFFLFTPYILMSIVYASKTLLKGAPQSDAPVEIDSLQVLWEVSKGLKTIHSVVVSFLVLHYIKKYLRTLFVNP